MKKQTTHTYKLVVYNGRVKIYIDGYVFVSFNQIDFKGYYAFKDDTNLYGIDLYMIDSNSGGSATIETSFKTKSNWLNILKLLDSEL